MRLCLFVLLAAVGGQIQNPPKVALPNAPVKLKLNCPLEKGRYIVPRGELFRGAGGPFGNFNSTRHLRLFRGGSVATANGQSMAGSEVSLPSNLTSVLAPNQIQMIIPVSVSPGEYSLQLDVSSVGSSAKIPIKLVEAPPKIMSCTPPEKAGGSFGLVVQGASPGCKFVVARTTLLPVPDWWTVTPARTNQATLTPQAGTSGQAGASLFAILPESMGAGDFEVWVQTASGLKSAPTAFRVSASKALPVYSMRYDGIDSIIDTNELGDDEMYAIFSWGAGVMDRKKLSDPWTDNHETYFGSRNGPVHPGLQKGQSRSSAADVFKLGDYSPVTGIGFAVSLFEQDDPKDEAGFGNMLMTGLQGHENMKPNQVKDLAAGIINDARNKIDFSDEYLGTKDVPLADLIKQCRTVEGWHKTSVVISGDGGQFRLHFSMRADPKVGAYDK